MISIVRKLFYFSLCGCFILFSKSCSYSDKDYTQYVDPFIGTGGHGHTFPGAVVPYGMVQLSPDTRLTGWDACSGYHYSDSIIIGFSHTHLSGTGIGDYGDILMMPVSGGLKPDYRSAFSHEREFAEPGYYSVWLDDYGVKAELTATTRCGFHKYTYPENANSGLVLDISHTLQNHANKGIELRVLNNQEVIGYKNTRGWAVDQPVYFHARFSKPFIPVFYSEGAVVADVDYLTGKDIMLFLQFETMENEEVFAKVGISAVDYEGAKKNLDVEIEDWNFDKVRAQAKEEWNRQLSRVEVKGKNEDYLKIFYTGLYHASISPNIFMDVDGRYRGMDREVHKKEEGSYYTVFSLWDTYRGLHPLLTIIDPKRNEEFVASLVDKYEEGGCLPMWDLASNYTGTMTGYHAVSVIVEAYVKGAVFDFEKAFEACVHSSNRNLEGIKAQENILKKRLMPVAKFYKDSLGYIPSEKDNESVAKGLEYAYNDWCIAQFAKGLGKEREYLEFIDKSQYYKNYFDEETGFMRGKMLDGTWRVPFDPRASNHRNDDYCEGNAWQWSWYVPHDVNGLIKLHGGKEAFVYKLDSLFSVSSELTGEAISADISGLIGQYAHGNEPSHHITHLYNYVGQPWKTQELVDEVLQTLYFAEPNGLSGNEDCGQMSAWFILNSIGFYPVCPASGEYTLGRPLFDKVSIRLPEGKTFEINVRNNSPTNKYIQSVTLNGQKMDTPFITHHAIMNGGLMEIKMSNRPNRRWGANGNTYNSRNN